MKLGNFETTAATQVFLLIHFYHSKEHNNYLELLFKKAMVFKDDADGNVRSQVNKSCSLELVLFQNRRNSKLPILHAFYMVFMW